ncbi:MAG: SurA N-terminal domain-containing protein [Deltaproteobacteria bacterium]|nr:SurA N-terminal domain-containing protein [Deltaproteobacteria bacterium]
MLDFLRRFYASTVGKIITILVGVLFVVGFSFLPYIIGGGGEISSQDVATVGGKGISTDQFNSYYGSLENEYERLYGNKLNRKQLKELNLSGAALSSLIADKVLESKTGVFGIYVSAGFIARNIALFPSFQKNGEFSNKLFNSVLLANHTTPADFEKSYKSQIARSYIRRAIEESFSMADGQFLDNYKIDNKSVAFKIALFKSLTGAGSFLKRVILSDNNFKGLAKEFKGTLESVPLYSETGFVKSSYFKKYGLNESVLKAIFSTPANVVISKVFPVKSEFAVIKISSVYFPKYINVNINKNKKNTMLKQKKAYAMQEEQEFLYNYVNYLESKADIKINKNALAAFHF